MLEISKSASNITETMLASSLGIKLIITRRLQLQSWLEMMTILI